MEKKRDEKERPAIGGGEDEDEDVEEKEATETTDASSTAAWWIFAAAHPCSLLQFIARACASSLLGLCGGSSVRDGRPRSAAADAAPAADPAATSHQPEAGRGNKADPLSQRDMAGTQVLATRRMSPRRPGGPREGRGGGGGSHN